MFYRKQGNIPKKRHTQHRSKDNLLYYEELISREGFSSIYSNVYHLNMPTKILEVGDLESIKITNNIIERSNSDESSSKRSDSNFNGCGQDITEEFLKSK